MTKEEQIQADFAQIENQFKSLKLTEPSDELVMRVIDNAKRELKPSFFATLSTLFVRREYALALTVVLVVGLSFMLNQSRHDVKRSSGFSQSPGVSHKSDASTSVETAATFSGAATQNNIEVIEANQDQVEVLKNYATAVSLYQQQKFKEASDSFASLIDANPNFEKRVELYTYWIDALTKIGDTNLASQKQQELEKIK